MRALNGAEDADELVERVVYCPQMLGARADQLNARL